MVMHNVVIIQFVRIPKARITVVVDMALAEIHRRPTVNRWKESVPMEQFAIEMQR